MGQRHQVYVATRQGNNKLPEIYPYYHQWLYGNGPVLNVLRLFDWQEKAGEYQELNSIYKGSARKEFAILAVMSVVSLNEPKLEWFQSMKAPDWGWDDTVRDFTAIWNNDGITIIDIDSLKYCFMFMNGQDGRYPNDLKDFTPLSAEEYLKIYYDPSGEDWKELGLDKTLEQMSKYEVLDLETVKPWFLGSFEKVNQ